MDLAFDDHRIDDVAAIVDGHKSPHFDFTRAFVDIDNADVTAERIREVWWIVVVDRFEPGFHGRRLVGVSGERDLVYRLRSVGRSFDGILYGFRLEVVYT